MLQNAKHSIAALSSLKDIKESINLVLFKQSLSEACHQADGCRLIRITRPFDYVVVSAGCRISKHAQSNSFSREFSKASKRCRVREVIANAHQRLIQESFYASSKILRRFSSDRLRSSHRVQSGIIRIHCLAGNHLFSQSAQGRQSPERGAQDGFNVAGNRVPVGKLLRHHHFFTRQFLIHFTFEGFQILLRNLIPVHALQNFILVTLLRIRNGPAFKIKPFLIRDIRIAAHSLSRLKVKNLMARIHCQKRFFFSGLIRPVFISISFVVVCSPSSRQRFRVCSQPFNGFSTRGLCLVQLIVIRIRFDILKHQRRQRALVCHPLHPVAVLLPRIELGILRPHLVLRGQRSGVCLFRKPLIQETFSLFAFHRIHAGSFRRALFHKLVIPVDVSHHAHVVTGSNAKSAGCARPCASDFRFLSIRRGIFFVRIRQRTHGRRVDRFVSRSFPALVLCQFLCLLFAHNVSHRNDRIFRIRHGCSGAKNLPEHIHRIVFRLLSAFHCFSVIFKCFRGGCPFESCFVSFVAAYSWYLYFFVFSFLNLFCRSVRLSNPFFFFFLSFFAIKTCVRIDQTYFRHFSLLNHFLFFAAIISLCFCTALTVELLDPIALPLGK